VDEPHDFTNPDWLVLKYREKQKELSPISIVSAEDVI
jgi:hypothetical protein